MRRHLVFGLLCAVASGSLLDAPASAQFVKETYYGVAHVQKLTRGGVCGDHELIINEEVEIPATGRFSDHQKQFKDAFAAKYIGPPWSERQASLVRPTQVVLIYTYQRRYDSFNCTNRGYGHIVAANFEAALKELESRKKFCGKGCSVYEEVKRWPERPIEKNTAIGVRG